MADPIHRLIQELARLPGIGDKSATRLAFHLLRGPKQQVRDLASALVEVVDRVRMCSVCMNLTESDPCGTCSDGRREPDVICVVASSSDQIAIERGGHFRGRYHVLHGLLSPLEGIGPDDLRMAELVRRLAPSSPGGPPAVTEVILATSPSVEGEATAMYLARLLKPLGVKVSRIATGLPVGGELEYTDQATIARALAHRATM
ncbi:MAG: recombination protein RecR [Kofleriaceae bacterium]|nr:recombination protein RecR [Kofleriaceae bacterium]MBP6838344.1 recombination protein RecR [Kofleriaceae bacterium]MBP9203552.1 recombination protein RecR [Kofleriaceae bacterium]